MSRERIASTPATPDVLVNRRTEVQPTLAPRLALWEPDGGDLAQRRVQRRSRHGGEWEEPPESARVVAPALAGKDARWLNGAVTLRDSEGSALDAVIAGDPRRCNVYATSRQAGVCQRIMGPDPVA